MLNGARARLNAEVTAPQIARICACGLALPTGSTARANAEPTGWNAAVNADQIRQSAGAIAAPTEWQIAALHAVQIAALDAAQIAAIAMGPRANAGLPEIGGLKGELTDGRNAAKTAPTGAPKDAANAAQIVEGTIATDTAMADGLNGGPNGGAITAAGTGMHGAMTDDITGATIAAPTVMSIG